MAFGDCLNFLVFILAIFIFIPNYADFVSKSILRDTRNKILVYASLAVLTLCIFEMSAFLIYILLIEQKFRGLKALFCIYPMALLFIEFLIIYYYAFYMVRRYR